MRLNDLWEAIGALDDEQAPLVLAHLYSRYEARLEHNPADTEALTFFQTLEAILSQVQACNANRR